MNGKLEVDEIWIALGKRGRYQLTQTGLLLFDIIPLAFHLLSTVFIAWRPPYQCNEVDIEVLRDTTQLSLNTSYRMEYGKCSIDVFTNSTNSSYVTTTGCLSGTSYSVPKYKSLVTEWDLVCDRAELGEFQQTLVILGQAFGAAIFTSLADRFGRKPVHVLAHIGLCCVSTGAAFAPNYTVFAVLRFFVGALQQGAGLTIAILLLEMYPLHSRYLAEVCGLMSWTTGVTLITPFAYFMQDLNWRYLQMALALFSAYSIIEWWLLDESLRWLLANGKTKQAEQVMRKACRRNKVNFEDVIKAATKKEFKEMETLNHNTEITILINDKPQQNDNTPDVLTSHDSSQESSEVKEEFVKQQLVTESQETDRDISTVKRYNVLTIFKHKRIFLNSLIVWYSWFVNSLVYYAITLMSSSLSRNRFLSYFLTAIVEYPAAFTEIFIVNRIGRRKTCMFFHGVAGVALIAGAVSTALSDGTGNLAIATLVFFLIGKYGITGSFSTIFLYTPELYPTNLRNAGIGVSSCIARVGGMLAPFAGTLRERVVWGPGAVSSVLCLVTVFLMSFLPETKGHELPTTIEELKLWYKEHGASGRRKQKALMKNKT